MLIVVDESGDPGFKVGSSEYFVMGMVVFDSFKHVERCSVAVDDVKKEFSIRSEFKFSTSRKEVKDRFFYAIEKIPFEVRAIIVDKKSIKDKKVKTSPEKFYYMCLATVIAETGEINYGSVIKIDKCGSRQFRNNCAAYIRRELPPGYVKNIKLIDSKKDNLIQLADMVTGCIARKYNDVSGKDAQRWYNTISKRITSKGKLIIK